MTVKETILTLLLDHPKLFKNKFDVYNFLFSVIGNGYVWDNGEIVEESDDKDNNIFKYSLKDIDKDTLKRANDIKPILIQEKEDFNEMVEKMKKYMPNGYKIMMNIHNNSISEWKKEYEATEPKKLKLEEKLYPVSLTYSLVCNFPENMKDDWANAREEWESYLKSVNYL